MPVTFECRSCGATLEVDSDLIGRPVACGYCRAERTVPGPVSDAVPIVRPISPFPAGRTDDVPVDDPVRTNLSPVGRVALVGVAMVGLLAAAAVAYTVANPTGATELRPTGAGFRVEMPGRLGPTPRTKTVDAQVKLFDVTTYTSERRSFGRGVESAEVSYAELTPAPDRQDVPNLLSLFANAIRQESNHPEVDRRPGTLDGTPSLLLVLEVGNRTRIVYQLAIRENRLVILAIAGTGYRIDHPKVKAFFSSFQFLSDS